MKYKNNYENYYDSVAHNFNFGSDLAFLWDFLNSDSHSLGVHFAPIGFDVEFANNFYDETKRGDGREPIKGMTSSGIDTSYTINLGLHYYYNVNHQFSVDYRYFANNFVAKPGEIEYLKRHGFTVGYAYKF